MGVWILGVIVGTALVVLGAYMGLLPPRPLTSRDMAALFSVVAIPAAAWYFIIKPWSRLFDDRITPAMDSILALREKPAQLELRTDGDTRQVRVVRYTSTCAICGAAVYLDDGSPDFPRRMVGRCSESPREHVFSFDRITREGSAIRSTFDYSVTRR